MPASGVISEIKPDELVKSLRSQPEAILLLDVRTALEFDGEHIEGSRSIPLDSIGTKDPEIGKEQTAVLICRSGKRAERAATKLATYGYTVKVLEGGILNWRKCGMPLTEGKKRLSLERQVQLTIGLILLGSVALGFLVNKGFFVLPGFIGLGLTFAGLTGNCGLAMLIAKAPWNRLDDSKAAVEESGSCCSH